MSSRADPLVAAALSACLAFSSSVTWAGESDEQSESKLTDRRVKGMELAEGLTVGPDNVMTVAPAGEWSPFDRRAVAECSRELAFSGKLPKVALGRWMKNPSSLPYLLVVAGKQDRSSAVLAKRLAAESLAEFDRACTQGAESLIELRCSRVRFIGQQAVMSYVTGSNGFCDLHEGTEKDVRKWIKQAPTEAERLKRSEDLKTLTFCRAVWKAVQWDYVRPKPSDYPGCMYSQSDEDVFP